ncbi:hypothetical protein [Bradyrhizobium sp. AZCC 2230]|uniref:hypothetical protein n=1 Tax=Bradyrhizobium sp. AZCC 2230 TaxID=3117021 RepID=UPI002FF1DADF
MRLAFWQKTAVFFAVAAVGLSGLLWFVLHDIVAEDGSELTCFLLMLHGVASYALLVAVGSLLPLHIRAGWLRRRNIVTGILVTVIMAVLSVTALMLYYGSEETQAVAKWAHLAFGFGCLVLFPAHAFLRVRPRPSHDEPAMAQDTKGRAAEPR